MNLQNKKARIPIAALSVTALCSAGLGIFASPAQAAGAEIGLNSGATSIAVGNFGTTTTATANAAYALKVQEAVANSAIAVDSAPTSGKLAFEKRTTNQDATGGGFTTVPTAGSAAVNEVETIAFSSAPDSGSYTVTVAGQTTAAISTYTAAALKSALDTALGAQGPVTVSGTGTGVDPFEITFGGGTLAGTNVTQLTVDTLTGSLEDGGVAVTATAGTDTEGAPAGATGTNTTAAISGGLVNTDYVYVTGDVPGAYKFRIFSDTNGNLVYDSADERTTAQVTLNVYDTRNTPATVDTGDDADPVIAATSPTSAGDAVSTEITYSKPLSLSDARGSGVATGLAGRLADLTFLDVTQSGATGVTPISGQKPTYSTTTNKITYPIAQTPTGAGSVVVKGDLVPVAPANPAAYPTTGSKTINVTASTVAAVTLGATAVDGSVKETGGAVSVKAGTAAVEYTATAVDNAVPAVPVANAKVTFTVTASAANIAKLSADGTAGATTATTKTYTATTDSKGVAKLKVTASDPAAALTYTVDATSNGVNANATQQTATYATAAASTIETTSTSSELTPTVGTTSVTLKGAIKDQFGGVFVPGSGDSTQVTVQIPDGTQVGFAPLSSTGTFSYTYTAPTSPAPAVGDTTTFDFVYGAVPDASSPGGTIRWASAAAVSKITLTTPANGAKAVTLLGNAAPIPAQANAGTPAFGNATGAVTGTAYDANNAVLAYKAVTLKGGNGVWFSKTATPGVAGDKLVESLDVVTDASGVISGAYVYFTKAGDHKVTATSGSTVSESTVTVDAADNNSGWSVSVDDIAGAPGSTLIVTGKVTDIFGNPVAGAEVNLSLDPSTVGSLGNQYLLTNASGVFSTTFLTGSNSSGDVKLTAEIFNNPSTLTPNATLVAAGFTAPTAADTAVAEIKIAATKLTISSTAKVTAGARGGSAKLSGKYLPNTSVDIYARESGAKAYGLVDSVQTDAEGEWGTSQTVDKSTRFLARSNGLSSPSVETQVWSAVSISAKAEGKGRVLLSANGDPNAVGTLAFYRSIAGSDPLLKKVTSNSTGSAKVRVVLPKGSRSVYVTYKAPGTGAGQSKTLKINVK